jgi:hypothetical protein
VRKSGDLRLVFLKQIGRFGIFVEGARFELHHPNADQVARDAMTCGESLKRLAGDNSCATRRLNSMLWERCLAMAFILRIPTCSNCN